MQNSWQKLRNRSRQLPQMPEKVFKALSSLPAEEQLDKILNSLETSIESSGILQHIEKLRKNSPYIPPTRIPTPFGEVEVPEIMIPEARMPTLDERRKRAIKAAIAIDLAFIVGMVPLVGDIAADVIEDVYADRIREILTPEEARLYSKYDKLGPSTVAMIRAFIRR